MASLPWALSAMTLAAGSSLCTALMKSGLSWSSKREAQVEQGISKAMVTAVPFGCRPLAPAVKVPVASTPAVVPAATRPASRREDDFGRGFMFPPRFFPFTSETTGVGSGFFGP